jgi:hypothetical protein
MGWDEVRLGWSVYITRLAVCLLDVAKRLDPARYVNDAVWGELQELTLLEG